MTLDYTVRPLSDRTWLRRPHEREFSDFRASWSDTLEMLGREVGMLDGQRVVVGIDIRDQDLRIDGRLRANARPAETDAVELAFDSKHGPLLYRCDQYVKRSYYRAGMESWQHNVRAIAMTLQALRAVDRYGAARSGEQYRGYRALPSGRGDASSGMTATAAAEVVLRAALVDMEPTRATFAAAGVSLIRSARSATHPDRHQGDTAQWHLVDNAEQTLRQAGWLPKAVAS